jgi:phosphoesterase RecJ-like protein
MNSRSQFLREKSLQVTPVPEAENHSETPTARQAVVRALSGGRSLVLPLHADPDGDSLGASLALSRALAFLGKRAWVVSKDPVPEMFAFLPGVSDIVQLPAFHEEFDTLVLIDQGDPGRSGFAPADIIGKTVVNIDHHLSNDGFGDARYVDKNASASCEMVYRVLSDLRVPLDQELASLLYTGMMTDTGSFRYDNTTSDCLAVASELVRAGARPALLARRVYETRTLGNLRLVGRALARLDISDCGRVCWTSLTQEMLESSGAQDNEGEGISSYTRIVAGVEVGLVFKETGDGKTRVSLRSKDFVDVAAIALRHGGGGHARAAGFTFDGPVDRAIPVVVAEACAAVCGSAAL